MTDPIPLRVSMVYPFACLGDQSYCDLLAEGIQKAEAELGVEIDDIESSPETWDTDLRGSSRKIGLDYYCRIPNGRADSAGGTGVSRCQFCYH